jgi:pre-mRNA-splicing helicase BRR2
MCLPLQVTPINKAHALLVLHFSRIALPPDLLDDCKKILLIGVRLLHALVDIISSFGYLKPLILTMQLCQMLVQAMWINDSPLLQIVDRACAENLTNSYNVKDVNDFSNMEDS